MNVLIQIHFKTIDYESKTSQTGEFKLRGRKAEYIAFDFWRQVQRESRVDLVLEKVLCEGEDITELVREIEKKHYYKVMKMNDDLPF